MEILAPGALRQRTQVYKIDCFRFFRPLHHRRSVLHLFILPLIINFGISFATPDIKAVFGISNIIGLALMLSVIFGLMFQFPLITYSLIRAGIASYEGIKNKRPYILSRF